MSVRLRFVVYLWMLGLGPSRLGWGLAVHLWMSPVKSEGVKKPP